MKRIAVLLLLFQATFGAAQNVVQLTVETGASASDCVDPFSSPDLLWQVNVENEGWVTYPGDALCFTNYPNLQYTASYTCPVDIPAQLQLCFRAFENDPIIPIGCIIAPSCEETICDNFDIPAPGQSATYTLVLSGGTSTGEVTFTITTSEGYSSNDALCNAANLGLLLRGDTVGDYTMGIYDNICATNANEPNPLTQGGFGNENGVWFQFTTGSDIGSLILVEALTDPQATGDEIDIQMGIYTSDNNACDGNFTLLSWASDNSTQDAFLQIPCPSPNTTYFILIDGAISYPGSEAGVFGVQVSNVDVDDAPDLRCDALMIGEVPANGSISLPNPVSNYCATSVSDPYSPNFVMQSSVWFQFIAPPSGHVLIEGISSRTIDSIGIQLGVYRAFNDNCNLFFQHIASEYTEEGLDESLEVTCLFPGRLYYLVIDGDAYNNRGIFTINISDAGDITPVTNQDITICDGDSFTVGASVYTATGLYADTLTLFQGCDSIVNTNLTVLSPIHIDIVQTQPAIGLGNANGIAQASATGGSGSGYSFSWCDGSTAATNSMLVGGGVCCVTVTDAMGCMADTCFTVEYITDIIPSYQGDTLACYGQENGQITFSAINGEPPYQYEWQKDDNTINGSGIINVAGEEVMLPDLPAGAYTITIMDAFFDTTITVNVLEPELLVLSVDNQTDASCFGFCDGLAGVSASGGVGGYQFAWSNSETTAAVGNLCAGPYQVTLTDANGCQQNRSITIAEPAEFIATAMEVQPVSCFEGSDGIVSVQTNGNPSAYAWNTGDVSQSVNGLSAGAYSVLVTNADGCQDNADVVVTQPSAPVTLQAVVEEPVSCKGESDAVLRAITGGPGQSFTFTWPTGAVGAIASGYGAGTYTVSVANEKGCVATTEITVSEPDYLQAVLSATDVTCVSGENGGEIEADTTYGGTPPYEYALDGVLFAPSPLFPSLFPGAYTVTVRDAAGCEAEFNATVNPAPELAVTLVGDASVQLGDSLRLMAQVNSQNVTYTWVYPDSSGAKAAGQTVWVSPLISSGFRVEVFDTVTLCRAYDDFFVAVRANRRVFIPNAFSPNEDGRNDLFMVFGGHDIVRIRSFRVFSRTGSLVFEDTDFQPNDIGHAWDGTFRGQELDPGVFVYAAEIEFVDGLVEVFEGDVVLVK
ncbi:MAG: gliding motility-associated C-terminal domain-containing protein [Phaeodactylibacter sp.]|nr:gliding motility-associated C-terminal domain-containing protein [Phaeodactylibacter sp.]MCB9276861.1 gliding motility-associated C-terminal domain-containing protein [Lewinellaceae bacterium]